MNLQRTSLLAALVMALTALPAAAQEIRVPYARSGIAGVPNYYVVQPGDTLSRISEAFFGNPFEWPRIWSYNPQITNPHWIYPGDVIFLRPPADPTLRPDPGPPGRPGTHYTLGGFYTGAEQESLGVIRFSPTPYRTLTLLNDIYVEFDDRDAVQVGDRFALNRVVGRIHEDGELVGVKYLVTGVIEVIEIPRDSPLVVCRIVQAWEVIERGDVLFANQRHIRVVEPREADVSVEAQIIDFLYANHYAANTHMVFIDAGYNDGVREGNRFTIWRRYDEYVEYRDGQPGFREEDRAEDMPWRPMGEALVIYTTHGYSTAVLTHVELEVQRGVRVTLTEGH